MRQRKEMREERVVQDRMERKKSDEGREGGTGEEGERDEEGGLYRRGRRDR